MEAAKTSETFILSSMLYYIFREHVFLSVFPFDALMRVLALALSLSPSRVRADKKEE